MMMMYFTWLLLRRLLRLQLRRCMHVLEYINDDILPFRSFFWRIVYLKEAYEDRDVVV